MERHNLIFLFLLFSLILSSTCKALEITVPQAKYVDGKYYIVKGQIADVTLKGSPNENVNVEITYKFDLSASNGEYTFSQKDFPIPLSARFYVKVYPVEDLTVEATVFWFLGKTIHATADENGVAEVSKSVPKGSYDIKLYGKTNSSIVHVECTAKATIKLDEKGEYVVSYDTSKLPVGYMIVNADEVVIRAYVVSSEDEIPTPTTPTPTQTTIVTPTQTSKPTPTTTVTTSVPTTSPTTTVTTPTTPQVTTTTPTTITTTIITTTLTPTPTLTPKQTITPTTPTTTPTALTSIPTPTPKLWWKIPGFEIILTIAGLVIIALWRR